MIAWNRVDTVLIDLDGTLLDLHFDNHFWRDYVPARFAERHRVDVATARSHVTARYREVEGTLDWYCVDYWTRTLGLDIARLKHELAHLVAPHPRALDFLQATRARGKRLVLVTNAHRKALNVKLARVPLADRIDRIVCSHELKAPKEDLRFWERLQDVEPYEAKATLLIDDSLPVLRAARRYGIAHLLAIRRPDSREPERSIAEFPAIAQLGDVI
jgi:GMP/IMP 5'-nucleotidase